MPQDVNRFRSVAWIKDSYTCLRNTECLLRYDPEYEMIARVTLVNEDAPEIPNLEFTDSINWTYLSTDMNIERTRVLYEFALEERDADKITQVVFFFDTLYGFAAT